MSSNLKNEDSTRTQFELIDDGSIKEITKQKKRLPSSTWFYVGFATDLGFTVALPIAGGAILGKYLDSVWGSYPKATLSLLFLGIFISIVGFITTIQEIVKKK